VKQVQYMTPIEKVKSYISILDVLLLDGIEYKPGKLNKCPFHNDKTPSMKIYPDTNSFYCFGCRVGGDVLKYWMLSRGMGYKEAIKSILDIFHIDTPRDASSPIPLLEIPPGVTNPYVIWEMVEAQRRKYIPYTKYKAGD